MQVDDEVPADAARVNLVYGDSPKRKQNFPAKLFQDVDDDVQITVGAS